MKNLLRMCSDEMSSNETLVKKEKKKKAISKHY